MTQKLRLMKPPELLYAQNTETLTDELFLVDRSTEKSSTIGVLIESPKILTVASRSATFLAAWVDHGVKMSAILSEIDKKKSICILEISLSF